MADGYTAPPQYDQKGTPEVSYGYAPPPQQPVVQVQPVGSPTIVVNQQQVVRPAVRPWKSGLFDCCDDMSICLCGTFCGFCLVCTIASDMKESKCVPCCVPMPVTVLRTKWRTENKIEGSIMNDCLLEAFCGPCSACQLAREVKAARLINAFNLN